MNKQKPRYPKSLRLHTVHQETACKAKKLPSCTLIQKCCRSGNGYSQALLSLAMRRHVSGIVVGAGHYPSELSELMVACQPVAAQLPAFILLPPKCEMQLIVSQRFVAAALVISYFTGE